MFRKDIFDTYVELQSWFTDESLAVALDLLHNSQVYFLDELTSVYRVHANSLANQVDVLKKWKYEFGVYKMQLYYAEKYAIDVDLITKLKIQSYIYLISKALAASQSEFINEVTEFFRNIGMDMSYFIDEERLHLDYKNQYHSIKKSYSYRIGKIIISPISKLRKIMN